MNILSAEVTEVAIGHIKISGLMDSEGNYYVGVPQVTGLFQFDSRQASRALKPMLGEGFQFDKVKTKLNPKAINAIPLKEFEKLVRQLDKKGNEGASQMVDALFGLSLHQLFSDAFGVKFEAEDRQQWLKTRQESKAARRTWTDAIKDYIARHPELSENDRRWMYSNTSDALNVALFGMKASKLCLERGCSADSLRDSHDDKQLKQIEYRENHAMRLVDKLDIHPLDAMKEAIAFFE